MEKIELLARFLEIEDLTQIEECSYDSDLFIVNPHTKKFGDSPEQKLEKINLVKKALDQAGITKVLDLEAVDFTPSLYKPISKVFYRTCEDLTKIGVHDLVNTLYFLCGCGNIDEPLEQEYRDLFDGKEIGDTRKETEISDGDYLVLSDGEADARFEEQCRSYIDDCMEIPENIRHYFDEERFIADCKIQYGRGNMLAPYDSEENEIKDPDSNKWFYIYRTN